MLFFTLNSFQDVRERLQWLMTQSLKNRWQVVFFSLQMLPVFYYQDNEVPQWQSQEICYSHISVLPML